MRTVTAIAALIGGLALTPSAFAHTPYLKPTTFAPDRPFVTVEAALTEGAFFIPDLPIRGEGDYLVTGNSGVAAKAGTPLALKEFTLVEVALPEDGTYRISTGDRAGRTGRWVKADGAWRPIGPADAAGLPAGAETMTTQVYVKAETYVTRGSPTQGALKPGGQGLEVSPVTHPNEVFAKEAFRFVLLYDGKPVANVPFGVARGGDAYAETRYTYAGKTDAAGAAAVTFAQPGVYVLETHYPERAEGSTTPIARSVAYSLTFEVTR